jgi:hypothetical protein
MPSYVDVSLSLSSCQAASDSNIVCLEVILIVANRPAIILMFITCYSHVSEKSDLMIIL